MDNDKDIVDVEGKPINKIEYSNTIYNVSTILYNLIVLMARLIPAFLLTYFVGIIVPQIYTINIWTIFNISNFWMIAIILFVIINCLKFKGSYISNVKNYIN